MRRTPPRAAAMISLVLGGTATLGPMFAHAQMPEPTEEKFQKEIQQRDAVIRSLIQRVENLERQIGTGSPAAGKPRVTKRAAAGSRGVTPPSTPASAAPEETTPAPTPPAITPPVSPTGPTPQPRASQPAPGQFEVSEEAAERALERTLVATGNLLVPVGFAEIEPLFSYTRRERSAQVQFNLNRNELAPALDLRVGLPWESQVELLLPYNFQEQQVNAAAPPAQQEVTNRWGNAIGDFTVGVAKTFVHESGWVPHLIGRVTYEIPTGPLFANQVPLTSGQSKLAFSLTAVKRQDPLVFVATAGYTKAFQSNQINPGDQINFVTGAFLAASPETTLRGVLQQTFLQDIRINDVTLRGSNTVQPTLTFGASSILGRGVLADLQVGFGLTNSAPKYTVILSATYRFGISGQ
jgi:hypothetical protein